MEPEVVIFSDQVQANGNITSATLSAAGDLRCGGWRLNIDKQVLGLSFEERRIEIRAVVEAEPGICFSFAKSKLIRKTFTFHSLSSDSFLIWRYKLEEYLGSLGRPKRLFVFVNPYGGKKLASKVFLNDVKPLLDDANIYFEKLETEDRLHAKKHVQSLNLALYDGIVCVSGDGILVEVLNGLLEREDWKNAIKTPLGVVPAGTGNGIARSLLNSSGEPCSPSNATLSIIREKAGNKCSLDVATISQGETKFFSMLMLAWGLVADIDIESEKYRWMGSARLDFYALERIYNLRKYDGCIIFNPAPGYEDFGEPLDLEQQLIVANARSSARSATHVYGGPEVELKNLIWRKVEGPFISVWLHNVPWGTETTMAAPNAQFSDGYLDLILIMDCPKWSLLKLLSQMNDGSHTKSPDVHYLKVRSLILQPGRSSDGAGGIIDVDGEVLARVYEVGGAPPPMRYDQVMINVDRGLATLFAPTIH